MKSDLINATQLKDVLELITPTAEEYAEALQKAMDVISEQPRVTCTDPSEYFANNPDACVTTAHAYHDTCNPTLMALQCKSCGGVIDKDTMTCKHCGMTYMLVNSSEINPRLIYPDF